MHSRSLHKRPFAKVAVATIFMVVCAKSIRRAGTRTPTKHDAIHKADTVAHDGSRASSKNARKSNKVDVIFYGEAECPFCREFVTEIWPKTWNDAEMRSVIKYDFVPWGNAYFATEVCGKGPEYSSEERACWFDKCIRTSPNLRGGGSGEELVVAEPELEASADADFTRNELATTSSHRQDKRTISTSECFKDHAIYQHSAREGRVDIYESCVKEIYNMETAVDFMICCEGKFMDDPEMDAVDLLENCTPNFSIADVVEECFALRGKQMEIRNAKATPDHPGVPYVTVNGNALDDARQVKDAICNELKTHGNGMLHQDLPKTCLEDDEVKSVEQIMVQ
uniref:Uncharacterized protein n=1 Tax=Craspedostauros australis TaxID=1486917 RepID=A0A7R9ZKF0_9STRA|mmetsp:Transcript_15894/g.43918  ORF Transcript_15894/g.43918 Transcript_15894/m.43918 type:complete len:338 (+) Transcript_15894:213-1226(+)|eukprot:CAMPEP_0198121782 /NCGR_PEP_ID=MMETSP1442-20131203/33053_1 /TAXON_ID= /ORGANISM="Craspedostauros australis, Strain CCMP3328" /LENGTH=337 /DNA_ID=CAMNT_0043780655 /DNA_START=160 /DNA_END=1173 /DNA_ORIENTATION=+